tara:strand:+ start:871 stop:5277 length:4407 start_codon:yes stop_codon:yes gene_type:complete
MADKKCYGPDGLPLEPNPADDGSFPVPQHETPPPPAGQPTGNEVVQDALDEAGRCYGPALPPIPPSRGDLPIPKTPETPEEPELTPNQVIQGLIGRCYPDRAPTTITEIDYPFPDPPTWDFPLLPPFEWFCDFFPDHPMCIGGGGPVLVPPLIDPRRPDWPTWDLTGDCEKIRKWKEEGVAERIPEKGEGHWRNTLTGEEAFCDDKRGDGTPWEECVRDTLECYFRPFATGTWKPPKGDCEAFYPRGWSGNKDQICIRNCFPERIPIYEATKGTNVGVPMLKPFSDERHNDTIVTINSAGDWNGRKLRSPHGNKYFNSATTITHSFNGFTVNVTPVLDVNEYDSDWWISASPDPTTLTVGDVFTSTFNGGKATVSVSITIIGTGQGRDHTYFRSMTPDGVPSAPFGYNLTSTTPAFYVLRDQSNGSVPLFKFFSDSTQDTLLTCNPGEPDSPGVGERVTMDLAGMAGGMILGYVFPESSKAIPYLGENESVAELHRYFNGSLPFSGEFDVDAQNIIVSGVGSSNISMKLSWNDNPSTAGVALESVTVGGLTLTQSGRSGEVTGSFPINVNGTQTFPITYTGLNAANNPIVKVSSRELCLKDGDGPDCNCRLTILTGAMDLATATDRDHKYTVNKVGYTQPPTLDTNRQLYNIPDEVEIPLTVFYDVQKGSAGYQNTWGVYLANSDGEPQWGQVILPDATNSVGYGELILAPTTLNTYKGGFIGFFLVPDGNRQNSVSAGDLVTFSDTGNGWRSSLNSAQSNYTIFSDRQINWNKKEFVRYDASNYQWWEDLLAGDEDYNDFKGFYRLQFGASSYNYEGVAAYVYRDAGPDPVMMDIKTRSNCDDRVFEYGFEDATVTRTGCGSVTISNEYQDYECGPCSGEYTVSVNKTQTVKITKATTLQLMSFGSITSSVQAEGMKFTITLKKNGTNIYQATHVHRQWPMIGTVLQDNITLAVNDTLTFEVTSIDTGNFQSANSVSLTFYDKLDKVFDHFFTLNLGSTMNDTVGSPSAPATLNDNPVVAQIMGGAVISMNMEAEYRHKGASQNDEFVWSYFSGRHDLAGVGNSDTENYVRCPVWRNSARLQAMQCSTEGPDTEGDDTCFSIFYADTRILSEGDNRYGGMWIGEPDPQTITYPNNPNNEGKGCFAVRRVFGFGGYLVSYGDTGKHVGTSVQGELSFPSFATSRIGCNPMPGFGTHREFDRGLFGWWADHPNAVPTAAGVDTGAGYTPSIQDIDGLYASAEECGMLDGVLAPHNGLPATVPEAYTNFHPDAFFQDYYLRNDRSPLGDAKIRVMFIPIAQNIQTVPRTHERMQCWIEIVEILDAGTNYRAGDVFELAYPPRRNTVAEDPDHSPFYPDQEAGFSMPDTWQYHTKVDGKVDEGGIVRVEDNGLHERRANRQSYPRRTPIEVIYQESHNKTSKHWYWTSNKEEDRIKFRVAIEQTNPATDDLALRYTNAANLSEFSGVAFHG